MNIEELRCCRLQDALLQFGVSAFVAHSDIEPTLEWQDEIEPADAVWQWNPEVPLRNRLEQFLAGRENS